MALVFATDNNKISITGKNVLVTGASSGIGEVLARQFAKKGLNVVLVARRKEKLEKIVNEIRKEGGSAAIVIADITSKEQVARAFSEAEDKFGPVHYTVANAGGFTGAPILDFTTDEGLKYFEDITNLNYFGAAYTIQKGIISARKAKGGVIVAVSSVAGSSRLGEREPSPFWLGYNGGKSGLDAFMRLVGPGYLKENIRLYSVAPHVYESEALETHSKSTNRTYDAFAKNNPIFPGKLGNPHDMVPIFLSLFDNTTLYRPGSVIACDNHVTFDIHERYRQMYTTEARVIPRDAVKDYQGKPYVWEEEKKRIVIHGTFTKNFDETCDYLASNFFP